jgi:hypothetical protein
MLSCRCMCALSAACRLLSEGTISGMAVVYRLFPVAQRLGPRRARPATAGPGRVAMQIAVTTGPGRNCASPWEPLIDAFGPCWAKTQPAVPPAR